MEILTSGQIDDIARDRQFPNLSALGVHKTGPAYITASFKSSLGMFFYCSHL